MFKVKQPRTSTYFCFPLYSRILSFSGFFSLSFFKLKEKKKRNMFSDLFEAFIITWRQTFFSQHICKVVSCHQDRIGLFAQSGPANVRRAGQYYWSVRVRTPKDSWTGMQNPAVRTMPTNKAIKSCAQISFILIINTVQTPLFCIWSISQKYRPSVANNTFLFTNAFKKTRTFSTNYPSSAVYWRLVRLHRS